MEKKVHGIKINKNTTLRNEIKRIAISLKKSVPWETMKMVPVTRNIKDINTRRHSPANTTDRKM